MNIVAVIQARMASSRLPGKVLMKFHDLPTIGWIARSLGNVRALSKVVVATSTNAENDRIEAFCRGHGIECFRGSEDDVLERYIQLIDHYKADAVVRITGDCPFSDPTVIAELIALFQATGVDYASNTEPPTFPDGLDAEIISASAIRAAHAEATRKSDRECVTRWIVRNRDRFPAANLSCPIPGLHKERWVLDSPEDLEFCQAVFNEFDIGWQPNWIDIHGMLNAKPAIRAINAKYQRNERFYESLSSDIGTGKSFTRTATLYSKAEKVIPFAAQTFSKSHLQFPKGTSPLFVSHGDGGYCYDVDGNDYVDLVGALLPNILGYRDPDVDWAVRQQLNSGVTLSLSTKLETELAELLIKHIPCAEMVKFGKNGSDVTTAAIRCAMALGDDPMRHRRTHVLKIKNNYHGWHDWAVTQTSRELGAMAAFGVHVVERDLNKIEDYLRQRYVAGIILEPEGWSKEDLTALRELCDAHGTLLIFDEVITGFRWSLGGYQKHIGVTPDLACFGKAMANGLPMSAIVGRRDYMKKFEPPNNIFYSGTAFGETLSLAAAIATINKMERENVVHHLWKIGAELKTRVTIAIKDALLDQVIQLTGDAPLVRINILNQPGGTKEQIKALFIKEMIQNGILIIGSHNLCMMHGENEIQMVVNAYRNTLHAIGTGLLTGLEDSTIAAKSVRA